MSFFNLRAAPWVVLATGLLGAPAVLAQQTWSLNMAGCGVADNGATKYAGSVGCGTTTVGAGSGTLGTTYASAFGANTDTAGGSVDNGNQFNSTGVSFTQSTLVNWGSGSGLGVYSGGESGSPNHSTDNYGYTDAILLHFTSAVTLSQITIGWAGGTPVDSDISIFALNSGVTPTGSGETSKAVSAMSGTTIKDGTSGGAAKPISSSWSLIGNYADADNPNGSSSDTGLGVNAGGMASSWWLISAYNSRYGGACTENPNQAVGTATKGCSDLNDYVKVLAVAGTFGNPPESPGVPEPASLALVAVALAGAYGLRRREFKSA